MIYNLLIKTEIKNIPEIRKTLKDQGLLFFSWVKFDGYYKPKREAPYIYLIASADAPVGDYLITKFGAIQVSDIFDYEEIIENSGNYEFVKILEKE